MSQPVRVGIIGAGFAGSFHLRSYRQVQGVPVEVTAIAGKTKTRAENLAKRYNVPDFYDDYRYILDDPSIQVVDLVVPNALHLPLVLEAAQAGKHIICEKPLTGYFGQGEPDDEVGATPKKKMLEKVREDLKIDLSLQPSGYQRVDDVSRRILQIIKDHEGRIFVTDKSPPEEIYALFGVSKKIFKKAIGTLYKKKLVTITPREISLTK